MIYLHIKNRKVARISIDNTYKKSNEFSMAKLNKGLSLNQTQLLTFAIYKTQQDGVSYFTKTEFEERFKKTTNTERLQKDAAVIMKLQFASTLKGDEFDFLNICQRFRYKQGFIQVKWAEDILPHISNLKEKYIISDLNITSQFTSSHSWRLYEYLKGNYGKWYEELSKEETLSLFDVSHIKSYQERTHSFKQKVLEIAIDEVNLYTEYEVQYQEVKKGRRIVGFELQWSKGTVKALATNAQAKNAERLHNVILSKITETLAVISEFEDFEEIKRIRSIATHNQRMIVEKKVEYDKAKDFLYDMINLIKKIDLIASPKPPKKEHYVEFYNWLEERY